MKDNQSYIKEYPVLLKFNSNSKFVFSDDNSLPAQKEQGQRYQGIPLYQVFHLLNEDGTISVNGRVYGKIRSDDSGVFAELNTCCSEKLNRNGICGTCYLTYRNNLKKGNYKRKNQLLLKENSSKEISRLRKAFKVYVY